MLDRLRLPLKALLANIPLEGDSIKMRVIGGSEPLEQICPKLGFVSIIMREC